MAAPEDVREVQQRITDALDQWGDGAGVRFDPGERLREIEGWMVLAARIDAALLDAVGSAQDEGAAEDVAGCDLRTWITQTRRHDSRGAAELLRRSERHRRCDLIADAQARGEISAEQGAAAATAVVELPDDLDDHQRRAAEETMLGFTSEFAPAELRRLGRHLIDVIAPEISEAHDAERLEREQRRARRRRSFGWSNDGHGSVHFRGRLPEVEAHQLTSVIDAVAHHQKRSGELLAGSDREDGVPPSFDQLRADAVMELVGHLQTCRVAPSHGGDRPRLLVTITEESLRERLHGVSGLFDRAAGCGVVNPSSPGSGAPPGAVTGTCSGAHGSAASATVGSSPSSAAGTSDAPLATGGSDVPSEASGSAAARGSGAAGVIATSGARIPVGELRALACDAELLPVVLGSVGEPLDVGRAHRLVTPAIRAALMLRDRGCVMPGCEQPPQHCEAHHLVPWQAGGATALGNLALLCRRHHRLLEPEPNAPPGSRWRIRMGDQGLPEVVPPDHLDPWRRARLHPRHRTRRAAPSETARKLE